MSKQAFRDETPGRTASPSGEKSAGEERPKRPERRGIPWRWDPRQFVRWGPFGRRWRRMLPHSRRRRLSAYPNPRWLDNPCRVVEIDQREALFDSWLLLALRRGVESAAEMVEHASRRCISTITYMDMLAAATAIPEAMVIRSFLQQCWFELLPVTEPISRRAALYMEYYGLSYGLSPRSALIAATAYEERLVLVSRLEDFQQLPELEIVPFPTSG